MTTRPATLDDLDAIMALERASFPTDAWSDAMMREELASRHSFYVVVEEAGRLVGYAGLRVARGASDADIQTIAVVDRARRRGLGRTLMLALLNEARAREAREVFLEVRADNPVAQALYASEGFAELGRRPRYYQPDGVDAVVMRLDLEGWVARPGVAERSDGSPEAGSAAAGSAEVIGPDQEIWREQDVSGRKRPDAAESPDLVKRIAASDAGACT